MRAHTNKHVTYTQEKLWVRFKARALKDPYLSQRIVKVGPAFPAVVVRVIGINPPTNILALAAPADLLPLLLLAFGRAHEGSGCC